MKETFNIKFEEAVRLLSEYLPPSQKDSRKPILFHSIRVGIYLYENNYSEDIVLAGLLHDMLEWSSVDKQSLEDQFGSKVLQIILACTKDDTIADKDEKIEEMIGRCIQTGRDALIVKTADTIDSFEWYTRQDNQEQLKNHCLKNADTILRLKPNDFDDKIFDELKGWQKIKILTKA